MYLYLFSKEKVKTLTKHATLNMDAVELSSMVLSMIESYDNNKEIVHSIPENKYHRYTCGEALLRRHEKTFCSIETIVNTMLPIEKKEMQKKKSDLHYFMSIAIEQPTDDDIRKRIREYVIDEFIRYISDISYSVIKRRKNYRLEIGSKISLTNVINTQKTDRGYIWFYKAGGWGLANYKHEVIIPNHLSYIPVVGTHFKDSTCILLISQDVDSNLYGVINFDNYEVIIPFEYNNITAFGYDVPFLLVNIGGAYNTNMHNERIFEGGQWGVYNLSGKIIIKVKYTEIKSRGNYTHYFDCIRDVKDEYVYNEFIKDNICIYEGKHDLYDSCGNLLIENCSHEDIDRYVSNHDCPPQGKSSERPF